MKPRTCRPRERGDPYAAAPRSGRMLDACATIIAGGYGSRVRRDDERVCRVRAQRMARDLNFKQRSAIGYTFAISPRLSREFWPFVPPSPIRRRRECRAPDAPDSRVCRGSGSEHTRCQVTPESPGIPRAMALRLTSCSSRRSAFLSPSPLRSVLLGNLTPAPRRQNHTTSPSAGSALVFGAARVHRILSRVRDDLEPPLQWDRTGRIIKVICDFGKSEYFCKRGWTGFC